MKEFSEQLMRLMETKEGLEKNAGRLLRFLTLSEPKNLKPLEEMPLGKAIWTAGFRGARYPGTWGILSGLATITGLGAFKKVKQRLLAARMGQLNIQSPAKGVFHWDVGPISLLTLPFTLMRKG